MQILFIICYFIDFNKCGKTKTKACDNYTPMRASYSLQLDTSGTAWGFK